MKYAIISDVHSNLEALERVKAELDRLKPDQIMCLGDVIGYGANPSECLKLVREMSREIVMGNHDRAIEDIELREEFNDWAHEAIRWTAGVLSTGEKAEIRRFVPIVIDRAENVTWTHGSAHEPEEFHYLFKPAEARRSFKALETDICFFGHTHIPSIFEAESPEGRYLTAGMYRLQKGRRYLINPGSVGQPRDRDPRLGFAFFDSGELTLEIVRLDYDNQKAAQKIRKAGLPAYLADRLL